MQKHFQMIAALFAFGLFLTFTGCGDDEPAPTPKSISVGDYSFLKRGNTFVYEYRYTDGKVEEYSITIDTIFSYAPETTSNNYIPGIDSSVFYGQRGADGDYEGWGFGITFPDSSFFFDDHDFPLFRKEAKVGEKWYPYSRPYDSTHYSMIVSEDASIDKYDNCVHVEQWINSEKFDGYISPKYGVVYVTDSYGIMILKSTNF